MEGNGRQRSDLPRTVAPGYDIGGCAPLLGRHLSGEGIDPRRETGPALLDVAEAAEVLLHLVSARRTTSACSRSAGSWSGWTARARDGGGPPRPRLHLNPPDEEIG